MSLPGIFDSNLQTIPAEVPYLFPEPSLVQRWRDRLAAQPPGLKVGLAWAGSADHPLDRQRSISLNALSDLARIQGVQFYSLQKGAPARQIESPPPGMQIVDWTAELTDFADTAALVSNLDLVISVDSAVAHLTGALGIPAWVLVQFVPDWRWLLDRSDSPWYPSITLFRQSARGDWSRPIRQLTDQLTTMASR
jgi:ADP-heptose:LPS heptosyltransferase